MTRGGVKYLFISADINTIAPYKIALEKNHDTLRCDLSLSCKPDTDWTQYCLLAIDVLSITEYPIELITSMRHHTHIPIIVLLPEREMKLTSELLDTGADTVLEIERPERTISHLSAFYRRYVYYQHQEPVRHRATMIIRDELIIEPKRRRVSIKGKDVELTTQDFELLNFLACNADTVVTHELIAERIWGSSEIVNGTLFSAITRLRQKIEPDPQNPTYIQTVYGTGYTFKSYIVES